MLTISKRRPGQNIRQLAMQRRFVAIASIVSAVLVVATPLILLRAINRFLAQLPRLSGQEQVVAQLPLGIYIFLLLASTSCLANGVYWWRRANRADQGALGEEIIAQKLAPLEQAGWQITYGMPLRKGLGDADAVCISPKGRAYVIDVKSHRGLVTTDGQRLQRRIHQKLYPFEKPFLKQAVRQAIQVKEQQNLKFVSPIIVFSAAKVIVPSRQIQNVYVTDRGRIVKLLKSLE